MELPDQTYAMGDSFLYDVILTNTTPAALTIPWSGDRRWLTDTPDASVFRAAIVLVLGNGTGRDHFLTAASMYGDVASLGSVHVLAPGASVRIHAAGQWSVSGSKFRDYLAQTDGRVSVRAKYQVTTGTHQATTPVSAPRSVTLVMPPR